MRCLALLGVAALIRKRKPALRRRKLIGAAIRHYRLQAQLTQERLAEMVNLNPKYIGEVERGEKIISIEALLRVSTAVRVRIGAFFDDV